jgi:DNA-binding response OmpR family regulator
MYLTLLHVATLNASANRFVIEPRGGRELAHTTHAHMRRVTAASEARETRREIRIWRTSAMNISVLRKISGLTNVTAIKKTQFVLHRRHITSPL